MKKIFFTLLLGFDSFIYAQEFPVLKGDYLGQTPPGDTPVVFAAGIVSVENKNSHALVFSPDDKMIIFSRYPDRTSYVLTKNNSKWEGPVESFFYGKEISFSSDGKKIFYYTDADIFFVEKESGDWSQPARLGPNVNTNIQAEYYPCIVKSGDMYFSRDGNWKTGRIMHSKLHHGEFQKAVDIGLPVNSGGATHAWVSSDESYMLFNSPRAGSYTRNDIWVSYREKDDTWTAPKNLGKIINSGADAILCPTVSPDGKYMFFTRLNYTSNTGYIYWVRTKIIDKIKRSVTDSTINK